MVGIYSITNTVNGKIYIGQSIDVKDRIAHHKSRLRHNRHENDYLQKAWNKYGEECFEFNVLEECSLDKIDEIERKYIDQYDSMNRDKGYNFESGGSLHKQMSEESKVKMSIAKQGVYDGEKNPMYGVHLKHSDDWRKWAKERFSGTGNPMYGRGKKTRCVETQEEYQTASEASRKIGVKPDKLLYAIKKGTLVGGFHWEFVV